LSRLVRQASEPSAYWRTYLARACERFGLVRPVRLLCSASAVTPMLIGWIKPVILLPASMFSGFTPQQIELIIAHELGHIRRWDYLANLFQVVIETVLFYHPVVHWISRDVRNARESCCDDLVLSVANGNPLTYARALANLEELRHDLNLIAPALGAGGGVLLTRIRRIVGVAEMLDPLPRSNAWPLLLAAAAVVCLAWRPQHVASELSVALSAAPAQTLAMVSGNPRLAAAAVSNVPMPSSIPTIVPMTASPNAQAAAEDTTSAPALVHIARPRVNIGAASHLDRVHDLAVATPVATRIADIAEPVSVPLSPPPSAVDAKPSPLHVVAPAYPSRAMAAGIEGNVELEFAVGADGRVRDVRVVHAQPDREFDAAAKAALAAWRFPASQSSDRYTQTFTFTLHARAADDSGATCQQLTGSLICRRPGE
jgi:TonB family protein